jgi:hypothetical protein
MKTSQTRLSETRRLHSEAEAALEKHIAELFRRAPMLAGFSIRHDLQLDDVTVHSWPGYTAGPELYEELLQTLADIGEERPATVKLLRGRTFARAFH